GIETQLVGGDRPSPRIGSDPGEVGSRHGEGPITLNFASTDRPGQDDGHSGGKEGRGWLLPPPAKSVRPFRYNPLPASRSASGTSGGSKIQVEPFEVICMEYEVRLEQLDSRPLAVVRRRASAQELAKVVPDACGLVWNVVRAQQIAGAGRH